MGSTRDTAWCRLRNYSLESVPFRDNGSPNRQLGHTVTFPDRRSSAPNELDMDSQHDRKYCRANSRSSDPVLLYRSGRGFEAQFIIPHKSAIKPHSTKAGQTISSLHRSMNSGGSRMVTLRFRLHMIYLRRQWDGITCSACR